jgi:hypothetical protein
MSAFKILRNWTLSINYLSIGVRKLTNELK